MSNIKQMCDVIREVGFGIHGYLRHGHLERVYETALAHRLPLRGLRVVRQHPLQVLDEDGTPLGEFFADLFIEDQLLIELKAVRALIEEHIAQTLGYMRAARIEHGLLINFGAPRFEIRKFILNDPVRNAPQPAEFRL
jgi:GxxExxY protein